MKPITNWENRYREGNTGWDIGYPSTPLKAYFDQLEDKSLRILIPGCGNAYEASYLFNNGFKNVSLLDIAALPLTRFAHQHSSFPPQQLMQTNFFNHTEQYDLIVEQTFFCAIAPTDRAAYAKKVFDLLRPKGKLVGLLWAQEMNVDSPPFGGNKSEYKRYFDPYFHYLHFDLAYNSIKPRKNKELFILAQKKS